MYKRRAMGEHLVGVCTNTLCAVMGGDAIWDELTEHLGIGNDETTEDGTVTLERIECNAACDFAPVLTVNWDFMDCQTPQSAINLVESLRAGEEVRSTRGAVITSWREAERVIAGYEDGRVDEGPAAAGASLAGLEIARERGWSAPDLDEGSRGAAAEAEQATAETAEGAVEQADTERAEAETEAATSPADTASESSETGDSAEEGGASDD